MHLTPEEERALETFCAQAFDFARDGNKAELETMLNAGLNVNLANHKGNTLLMLAAYHNQYEIVQMLLKRGADVDRRNDKNQTPLAGVCFKGYEDIAKLLLEYGANPDADNGMGLTPINCACLFRRKDILKLLLKHSQKKLTFFQRLSCFFLRVKDLRGKKSNIP